MLQRLSPLGCLLAVSLAAPASATTVLRAPLSELAAGSDVIFHGVVRAVDDHLATSRQGPFLTAIELEVVESIKGVKSQSTFRLVLPGGRAFDRTMRIPGMPTFDVGDEVVLLLERTQSGFALAGMSQGVFRIDRSSGKAMVGRNLAGLNLIQRAKPNRGAVEMIPPQLGALIDTIRTMAVGGAR